MARERVSLPLSPSIDLANNVRCAGPGLGVTASDSALLYVICSPTGPYFRSSARQLSLLAIGETVRAWPGGTGGYKLALNYAPTLKPQQIAEQQGYNQVLWLLGEKVCEAGAMNFFAVVKRDDGGMCYRRVPLPLSVSD